MIETKTIETDVLIVGGGTAGCYAATVLSRNSKCKILIAEKANIKRSGCLAAGVNALNAFITEGHVPEDYVRYAQKDASDIVRGDLLLSMSRRLNEVTYDLERMGLVILKDAEGKYVSRGWRNIKINGENIKPLLANAANKSSGVTVLNHVNLTDLVTTGTGKQKKVVGAVGFSLSENVFYNIKAKVVLIATGGASGLYRPNNPGFSRHKMWYSPFNTGAGFAMGFKAGAEMTTFEMRFIALRCKDTIAPTGTIAQGVGARQINSEGSIYEEKYGLATSERLYGTVSENQAGRGPCYLHTKGISADQEQDLYKAYLNMAPSQTLKWFEQQQGPASTDVEIEGTEPYIVGGHTASGFWIDDNRRTTVKGLYAAGDVAGGCPQKYVTGALAEAAIAAEAIAQDPILKEELLSNDTKASELINNLQKHFNVEKSFFSDDELEEAMQKIMDQYAGGIGSGYKFNTVGLNEAKAKIKSLLPLADKLKARNMNDLLRIAEVKERLVSCLILIAHLGARQETRWHSFAENADFPQKSSSWEKYVNSKIDENGEVSIVLRPLVKMGEHYEHSN